MNPNTQAEIRYNRAHTHTRVVIERCFGVTKQRFRCLHKSGGSMTYAPGKCCKIILACMILHNMCIDANVPLPDDDEDEDDSDDNDDNNDGHNDRAAFDVRNERDGFEVRRHLINTRFTR